MLKAMKKHWFAFFIIIPLILLVGCEDLPPSLIIEYSKPPAWLYGRWVDSLVSTQYEIEVTSQNITISENNQEIYSFSELDELYYMTVKETNSSFVVTATATGRPTVSFSFTEISTDSFDFFLDHSDDVKDIGPISFVTYQELGTLDVQIHLPDDPIILTLVSTSEFPVPVGNPVTIEADLEGQSYQWYLDGVLLSNQNEKTLIINTSQNPLSEGEYIVVCRMMQDGCVYFDSLILSIE